MPWPVGVAELFREVPANSNLFDVTSDDQRFLMARALGAVEMPTILVLHFFEELKRLVPP